MAKEDSKAKTFSEGAASAGLAARGAQYLKPTKKDKISIGYGYTKGKGIGHKSLAKEYANLLRQEGYEVDTTRSNSVKGALKYLKNSPEYKARINTGFGIPSSTIPNIDTGMSWDYDPDSPKAYPFSKPSKDIKYRKGELAKKLNKPGKKIVTLAGGEAGYNLEDKLKMTQKALKGRKDIEYLVLGGRRGKELSERFKNDKKVTVKGFMPSKEYQNTLAKSDLNIGYTGSSSIAEQLSSENPSVILSTLDKKNRKSLAGRNLEYAEKHYGLKGFTKSDTKDFSKTINKLLDNPDTNKIRLNKRKYLDAVESSKKTLLDNTAKAVSKGKKIRAAKGIGLLAGAAGLGYKAIKGSDTKERVKNIAKSTAGAGVGSAAAIGGTAAYMAARKKAPDGKMFKSLERLGPIAGGAAPLAVREKNS